MKECRNEVKDYIDIPSNKKTFGSLIAKINQVLADNKIQANTVACNKIQEKNNDI